MAAFDITIRTQDGLTLDRKRLDAGSPSLDIALIEGRWVAVASSPAPALLRLRLSEGGITAVNLASAGAWRIFEYGSGKSVAPIVNQDRAIVPGDTLAHVDGNIFIDVAAGDRRTRIISGSTGMVGENAPDERAGQQSFSMTAFGPDSVRPGESALLQAFFHLPSQRMQLTQAAAQKDRRAKARGSTVLAPPPGARADLRITLEADGLAVDEPDQRLSWLGDPVAADFEVAFPKAPERSAYTLKLRAELNGAPLGTLKLRVAVGADARPGTREAHDTFRHYEFVFLSYAHEDRARVLDVAQAFDRMGIAFFQDVLSLRAGDDWEVRLSAVLGISDAFMLFWSKAAAASDWVMREAQMALALRTQSGGSPDILPFIMEQPPPVPPKALAALHLNDPISCVRAVYAP